MIDEGRALRELHEHVTVKVPFCEQGLEATHALTADGIPVNMTLVFSPNQALLAAGAGATYVSCFMGRLDDISVDSTAVVEEIVDCFRAGGVTSQIIAASIRHPEHVVTAAKLELRDRHRAGQGAAADARPPAHRRRRRALPRRLGVAARVRRVAARADRSAGSKPRAPDRAAARLRRWRAAGPPICCRREWPAAASPTRHLAELHALAADAGVPDYRLLRRDELVEQLSEAGVEPPERPQAVGPQAPGRRRARRAARDAPTPRPRR